MSETTKNSDSEHHPAGLISSSSSEDTAMINAVMTTLRGIQLESLKFPNLQPGQKLTIQQVSFQTFGTVSSLIFHYSPSTISLVSENTSSCFHFQVYI
jgi:hypothetical protein